MKQLYKIVSYPFSALFFILFGLNLLFFHPIQWICLNIFGYQAHKKSVDYFNWVIIRLLHIVGTTYSVKILESIPRNIPIIIASNHQSMWDISPLIWFLRKCHPKFISKIELGKGIPSVSFNLKYGGSVLIDRKNPQQATEQIAKIAKYISRHNRSVVIFPEGTRSRNGVPKTFHRKGLTILFKNAPEAYVLPVTVNNSWKLQQNGLFPIPLGVRLHFLVHPAIKVSEYTSEALIDKVEKQIKDAVIN
ncbi:1-acyl-sn-glycerol-3-phosphate acyltransferase [Ulvibacter sp. MAR_2010_11]|uniref:lysophospholipid acyltransferase family protein n=1 Tax=Ulvibacter sp. MAR_2010_11 TaxID=1250229 RepID=UPI000C2B676A|nr:lysophospholipid acyltransferase family protein [Ulvibacter sp. MAR_2010_11]PKA82841.1 1-acyl-sn-glycerol-3-phosphate acyltransferase [Ulvibacter sp. MAR_2010_11]